MSEVFESARIRLWIIMAFFVVLPVAGVRAGGLPVSDAPAQASQSAGYKLVQVEPQTKFDAVFITRVTVGSQEVPSGAVPVSPGGIRPATPFQAGPDWMNDLTIYIYNRTNKNIVFAGIALGFPETGNGRTEPQSIYHIKLGRIPAEDAYYGRTGKPIPIGSDVQPIAFGPHQTLAVKVGDYINQIRSYAQNQMLLSGVTKVIIHRDDFFFEDGMRWTDGGYATPDPNHRGRFIYKSSDYFPGVH